MSNDSRFYSTFCFTKPKKLPKKNPKPNLKRPHSELVVAVDKKLAEKRQLRNSTDIRPVERRIIKIIKKKEAEKEVARQSDIVNIVNNQ